MGRHLAPEEAPPPKNKPRYRFLVAIAGIAALALLSMAIVASVFPEQQPPEASANTGEPFPAFSGAVPETGAPTTTPGGATPAAGTPGAGPTTPPPPAAPTATPPAGPPPSGDVGGAFAVVQSWDTGFIAGVNLTNAAPTAQAWQVTVVFPPTVGELRASWIEGGPGLPLASRSGQAVTFRSDTPLAAGVHVGLRFQLDKAPGAITPLTCTVNGRACG